ncbi:hypothetical protein SHIRM173S_09301 [Streptomyces hirsutus]
MVPALARASSASSVAERLGSSLRPVPVIQKIPASAYGGEIQLGGVDLQVGSLGPAVEVQREVVRREDLAEGDRRRVRGDRGDPPVVDAEVLQGLVQIGAEGIVSRTGDHGRRAAEPGGGDRDVRGRTAEELSERFDLCQGNAGLQGVKVHPDAAHGDQVEILWCV